MAQSSFCREAREDLAEELSDHLLMTLVKVVVVLGILGTGNLLLMGGAFYAYRQYTLVYVCTIAVVGDEDCNIYW